MPESLIHSKTQVRLGSSASAQRSPAEGPRDGPKPAEASSPAEMPAPAREPLPAQTGAADKDRGAGAVGVWALRFLTA